MSSAGFVKSSGLALAGLLLTRGPIMAKQSTWTVATQWEEHRRFDTASEAEAYAERLCTAVYALQHETEHQVPFSCRRPRRHLARHWLSTLRLADQSAYSTLPDESVSSSDRCESQKCSTYGKALQAFTTQGDPSGSRYETQAFARLYCLANTCALFKMVSPATHRVTA